MTDSFFDIYKAYEDRFRGPRELVADRMRVYLPAVAALPATLKNKTSAIDLGCGRGEWLGLLAGAGWRTIGVDLNVGMLRGGEDARLKLIEGDALDVLKTQATGSAGVISSFHMVEHVTVDYLLALLAECHRVLAEEGLLILETPNPENISVSTFTFHLDPTHLRPLPPELLEFFVLQAGFTQARVARLNGDYEAHEKGHIELAFARLFYAGPDYGLLAVKGAPQTRVARALNDLAGPGSQPQPRDISNLLSECRAIDDSAALTTAMGLLLGVEPAGTLTETGHLQRLIVRAQEIEGRALELERRAQAIEGRALELQRSAQAIEGRALELERSAQAIEHRAQVAAEQLSKDIQKDIQNVRTEASDALAKIHASTSWQITRPLRDVSIAAGRVAALIRPKPAAPPEPKPTEVPLAISGKSDDIAAWLMLLARRFFPRR